MAVVGYKNIGTSEYIKQIVSDKEYLLPCAYELALTYGGDLYNRILREKVTVQVNFNIVHPDDWGIYKINKNDIITITPALESGKTGAFLMIVAGIVLAAFAPQLSTLLWAGSKSIIYAISLSLALGGISSLLFRPDLPIAPAIGGSRETQTYSWSGIKTMARSDMPIPVVYGTHAVGGNVISLFTDVEGDLSYLYMLLGLCEGEIHGICQQGDYTTVCSTSNQKSESYKNPAIFIDDQPLSNYKEITWWYRNGLNDADVTKDVYDPTAQNLIPNFAGARVQYDDGREITTTPITYTTTKEVDGLQIQVKAPVMYTQTDTGGIAKVTAKYQVTYQKSGGTLYTHSVTRFTVSGVGVTTNSNTVLPGSNIGYKPANSNITVKFKDGQTEIISDARPPTYKLRITKIVGATSFTDNTTTTLTYAIHVDVILLDNSNNEVTTESTATFVNTLSRSIIKSETTSGGEEGYTTETIYFPSVPIESKAILTLGNLYEVSLNKDVKVGDEYMLTFGNTGGLQKSTTETTEIPITAKTKTGVWSTINLDFHNTPVITGKGIYDITIKRVDGGASDSISQQDNIYLNSVTEIVNGQFLYPNTALLGFKILATDQLSGSIPNIKTILRGTKVAVPDIEDNTPSGTDVAFDSVYWNSTQWELANGTPVYWNDTTAWRTGSSAEWSNSSILCVRDILTNKRYGLGNYITTSDFSSAGLITALKACHTGYTTPSGDHLSWWGMGGNTFDLKIGVDPQPYVVNNSAKTIALSGHWLKRIGLGLSAPLTMGSTYTYSVTIGSPSSTLLVITWWVHYKVGYPEMGGWVNLGQTLVTTGGVKSINYTPVSPHIDSVGINIEALNKVAFTATISNASIALMVSPTSKPHFHEWDGVLESSQSGIAVLYEMCDAFRCWPIWRSGTFDFIVDQNDTPIHTVTMGNIIEGSFSQSFTPLSEIPYKLIGQFMDSALNYEMRSVSARSNSTTLIKVNEKTIGLKGITDIHRAKREIVWKLNNATNKTHIVNFKVGMDAIHATAGDVINVQHQLPSWGQGGRMLSYAWDGSASSLTIDEPYTFANVSNTYTIKYADVNNLYRTATINTTGWSNGEKYRTLPLERWIASPANFSSYAIGKSASLVKPFRIISAQRSQENEVEITALEHLTSLYTEQSIIIINDNYSTLPKTMAMIPDAPVDYSVTILPPTEGLGFLITASFPKGNFNIKEIVVLLSIDSVIYMNIGSISAGQHSLQYKDNNLKYDTTYYIKMYCKTQYKSGPAVICAVALSKQDHLQFGGGLLPPSGIHIKGVGTNDSFFSGRDLTLEWNSVTVSGTSSNIQGYRLEIWYHDVDVLPLSVFPTNLLRTTDIKGESYTYTLDNILEDSGNIIDTNTIGSATDVLSFRLYTISNNNVVSAPSGIFTCYNTIPSSVTGLTAKSVTGGVQFQWTKSQYTDLKGYYYRTQVAYEGWSSWVETTDNFLVRSLSIAEITSAGTHANIQLEVKAKDLYNQISATASTANANATEQSDSLFSIVASSSVGTAASLPELYNSDIDSGGIRIP